MAAAWCLLKHADASSSSNRKGTSALTWHVMTWRATTGRPYRAEGVDPEVNPQVGSSKVKPVLKAPGFSKRRQIQRDKLHSKRAIKFNRRPYLVRFTRDTRDGMRMLRESERLHRDRTEAPGLGFYDGVVPEADPNLAETLMSGMRLRTCAARGCDAAGVHLSCTGCGQGLANIVPISAPQSPSQSITAPLSAPPSTVHCSMSTVYCARGEQMDVPSAGQEQYTFTFEGTKKIGLEPCRNKSQSYLSKPFSRSIT